MSSPKPEASAPISSGQRIVNLDLIRGVATLGILGMNAISFGLSEAAYSNISLGGTDNWWDWIFAVAGEILVDQKMMGLFSLLFGVGIAIFADRAVQKGKGIRLSIWRNFLLLLIGLAHSLIWEGDILFLYAICSVFVIWARSWEPRTLVRLGVSLYLLTIAWGMITQFSLGANAPLDLGSFWYEQGGTESDAVGLYRLGEYFLRALGMMLMGLGLYRMGIVTGQSPPEQYRMLIIYGFGLGLPLTTLGVIWQAFDGYSANVAIIGQLPNTLATIPMVMGYLGLISLWNRRPTGEWQLRFQAVGRMALTNYLTHSIIGITLLRVIGDRGTYSRSQLFFFMLVVWALQLLWSKWWLDRFRFGPFEWLWRSATYRHFQPLGKDRTSLDSSKKIHQP